MNKNKPKIKIKWREILRHPKRFWKSSQPFILSHHPECDFYRDHYVEFRGLKFCIGCFFGVIPAFITFLLIIFSSLWISIGEMTASMVTISFLILGVMFSIFKGKSKIIKILSKIFLAHGLVFLILTHYYYISAIYLKSDIFRIVTTVLLYIFLLQIYYAIRFISDYNTCKRCNQFHQYPLCDGFRNLIIRLKEERFLEIVEEEGRSNRNEDVIQVRW